VPHRRSRRESVSITRGNGVGNKKLKELTPAGGLAFQTDPHYRRDMPLPPGDSPLYHAVRASRMMKMVGMMLAAAVVIIVLAMILFSRPRGAPKSFVYTAISVPLTLAAISISHFILAARTRTGDRLAAKFGRWAALLFLVPAGSLGGTLAISAIQWGDAVLGIVSVLLAATVPFFLFQTLHCDDFLASHESRTAGFDLIPTAEPVESPDDPDRQ
jgi:hypothetical protein